MSSPNQMSFPESPLSASLETPKRKRNVNKSVHFSPIERVAYTHSPTDYDRSSIFRDPADVIMVPQMPVRPKHHKMKLSLDTANVAAPMRYTSSGLDEPDSLSSPESDNLFTIQPAAGRKGGRPKLTLNTLNLPRGPSGFASMIDSPLDGDQSPDSPVLVVFPHKMW
ncbi:hypothetical protein BC938DRAFT_482741 [Jimgerdemannia flammicorona]|uniref:Uncharacterized protein n=1 Tax=Jimgerdemannia flammicorona TaxID=994334 RepID=A0A433QDF8_9FUNG|nr:hypothetical protein BC938DRAFT_482741 [Jimgerdemannia flammicorona]